MSEAMELEEIIVAGSGGREHVMAEQAAKQVPTVVGPGNAGTEMELNCSNIQAASAEEIDLYAGERMAEGVRPEIWLGPEQIAVDGAADMLRERELFVLGANSEAAQAESSKEWAAEFNEEFDIDQPPVDFFDNAAAAIAWARDKYESPEDFVIKDSGLRSGKGVILPKTWEEAEQAIKDMFNGEMFGSAAEKLGIQDRFHGPEFSAMVALDNDPDTEPVILNLTQDHKPLLEGDEGPNTGGMGAYGPIPESIMQGKTESIQTMANKFKAGMQARGIDTTGMVLYIGGMLAEERKGEPVVIEYNVRFGDPEAQVSIPLLVEAGNNPVELFHLMAANRLREFEMKRAKDVGGVVLTIAAEGYPEYPKKGQVLEGLEQDFGEGNKIYFGGVKRTDAGLIVAGGRIAYVASMKHGDQPFDEAFADAYHMAQHISAEDNKLHVRRDIAHQARNMAA